MKHIVHTAPYNKKHDFGNFSQDKFSASKPDSETGSFTVKNVQPEDGGVYYCAISGTHCDADACEAEQKPQTECDIETENVFTVIKDMKT